MAHTITDPDETLYVVFHNAADTYHYVVIESGAVGSGQPHKEVFASEDAAYAAFGEHLPDRDSTEGVPTE